MGLKKYEIITVGNNKRVRALRSWQVGDRYVNIGDVGGIVYDEKTLSQDGACWLFRGNFNFPGARISGDSIVDVGEAALSITGLPAVDILGSSVVVGAPVRFVSDQTEAGAVVLTADDFEQGYFNFVSGTNWETWKSSSPKYLRTKAPIFMGGAAKTFKLEVPGYKVQAYTLTRDGLGVSATADITTGPGVTLAVPAAQYCLLRLNKAPIADIVPDDATAAQITTTAVYETKLVVVDSRLEVNPANGTGTIAIRPGGTYEVSSGMKYPDSIIQGSKVVINSHVTAGRAVRMLTELVNVNATIDATTAEAQVVGVYHGVYNLAFTGLATSNWNEAARSLIQAYDCDNMVVNPTNFPGLAAVQTAGVPIRFYNCNLNNGRFYHHAQIANTYRDINFDLATADLGKAIASGQILASAEVEGMYRLYSTTESLFGTLAEAHNSVKSLNMTGGAATYGTTIYKDAYLNGLFAIAGTNVFGNKVRSHPLAKVLNVQPRAVQGTFNALSAGGTITGVTQVGNRVCVNRRFRLNRSEGIFINGVPSGVETQILMVDPNDKIAAVSPWEGGDRTIQLYNIHPYSFIQFRKTGDAEITPADLAGVTVTVYNGCKIVNTGATPVSMKGNIRVEDNATLVNASITGSGYFGGNCVASGLILNGCAFMDNNAAFMDNNAALVKTSEGGTVRRLYMRDNSRATISAVTVFGLLDLRDNAVFSPASYGVSEADIIMRDNATITGGLSANGVLKMEGNAAVSSGSVTITGDITLCGSYNQTVSKAWTGKRVIDSVDAPEYDNNVKTQYDF